MAQPGELTLELARALPASPSVVFAAFSGPELAEWWVPAGFTVGSFDFDSRVGRTYRIEMRPPEGDPFYLTGEFREVDPPAHLAFTFVYETQIPTMSRPWSSSRFAIWADRRRLSSLRVVLRPKRAVSSTGTVGRTVSTDSSN